MSGGDRLAHFPDRRSCFSHHYDYRLPVRSHLRYGRQGGYRRDENVDIILSIPEILIIIVIKMVIDEPLKDLIGECRFLQTAAEDRLQHVALFFVYGILYWVGMARIVRGQILQLKEMEYVTAGESAWSTGMKLINHHLLPEPYGDRLSRR